jgi:hypothetical protein
MRPDLSDVRTIEIDLVDRLDGQRRPECAGTNVEEPRSRRIEIAKEQPKRSRG